MSDFKVKKTALLSSLGLALLFVSTPGLAQDSKSDEFSKCEEMKDASDRLKCFENVLRSMKTNRAPAYRPPVRQTDDSEEAPTTSQEETKPAGRFDDFGKREKPKEIEDERMVATVTKFTKDPNGKFTFYLDNGQVWKETDGSYIEIPRTVQDLGQVTIYKNFMGGFRIKVKNNFKDGRVKRLK